MRLADKVSIKLVEKWEFLIDDTIEGIYPY